jgi:hypothetical protein
MKAWMCTKFCGIAVFSVGSFSHAQSAPAPVKPGRWQISLSVAHMTALPPEAEAKIAAMPKEKQAQARSSMASLSKPIVATQWVCFSAEAGMDGLLSQAQQNAGMRCIFSNRVQTAKDLSFDMSCVGPAMAAQGHGTFHLVDDEHITGTSHLAITGTGPGGPPNTTSESTMTGHFASEDCAFIAPLPPPVVK